MPSLIKILTRRRTELYKKLTTRFVKSLDSGKFPEKSSRDKYVTIEKIRHLEGQLGVRSTFGLRHWALAAALGFVTVAAHGQDQEERGKLGQKRHKPGSQKSSQNQSPGEGILGVQAVPIFTEQPFFSDTWISEEIFNGDFDGDGDQDMLTFGYYGPIRIFVNDSTGQFSASTYVYGDVNGIEGIGIADVDNDGDLDVVVAEGVPGMSYDNNLFVLKNDGTGSFVKDVDQPQDSTDFSGLIQFADFDQDGDLDMAAYVYLEGTGSRIRVFQNDGTGLFTTSDDVVAYSDEFYHGDFDGDGDLDLIFSSGLYNIRLQRNDSTATFSGYSNIPIAPYNANGLDVGDMDADGDLDIVFETNYDVVVMDNIDGFGNFSSNNIFSVDSVKYNDLRDLLILDMDGDTDLDILVTEETNNFIELTETDSALFLLNTNNTGAFTQSKRFLTTNVTEADKLTAFDVDGDFDADVIASNYFDIVVYQNDGAQNFAKIDEDLIEVVYGLGAAIVDVDGDGDKDVINSALTQILKNDGSGNLTIFQDIVRDTDLVAISVASGDFDSDGDIDAVFTFYELNQPPALWTNNGSGTFSPTGTIPADSLDFFYSIVSGDMDNDGDLDLVAPGYNGNQGTYVVKVWHNDGAANFTLNETKLAQNDLQFLEIGDLNGDTIPDVISGGDNRVLVYMNLIDSLDNPQVFLDTLSGVEINDVTIGDIDGDGDNDFLAFNLYSQSSTNFKFINNGSGIFTQDTLNLVTDTYGGPLLEDFDLDGDLDLFLAGGEEIKDEFWENDGSGSFTFIGQLETTSYNPDAGDIDNDGDLDIFTNQYYKASLLIINNTNEPVADTIPPTITFDTLATNDPTPDLTGTIDDPTATISVNINATDYDATNQGNGNWILSGDSLTVLSDGFYTVALTATDVALNDSIVVVPNAVFIDTMFPVTSINTVSTNDNTPPLTGTIDDLAATISVEINGSSYGANNVGDSTWTISDNTITALPDGTFSVIVTATDGLGNISIDTTANAVFIDATAPVVTADSLITFDTSPELTGTVNDNSATISVDVDTFTEAAVNNGDGTWTLADNTIGTLGLGTYDVVVTATDSLGNVATDVSSNELSIITDPGRALDSAALVQIYNETGGTGWTTSTNWLTGTIDTWFGVGVNNDRVEALNLSGNILTGTFPLISTGLDALMALDLNNNELVSVSSLAVMTSLTAVDVTNNRLQFDDIQPLLAGPYTISYNVQKTALDPVKVLRQLGVSYTLDRTVAGADDYTWLKDGSEIEQTTGSFTIDTLTVLDDAIYTVEATSTAVSGLTITTEGIDLRVSSLARDEKSLRLVYNALDTENSTISDWAGTAITEWAEALEITITDNRVTAITLPGVGLEGPISDDLLDVEGLVNVDISGNKITMIPDVSSLTNLTAFDASDNLLDFGSIEPNISNPVTFDNQKPFATPGEQFVPRGSDVQLGFTVGGTSNIYQWVFRNDSLPKSTTTFTGVSGATNSTLNINDISYETMGQYELQVTNTVATGITLKSAPQNVLAFGDIEFTPVFRYADDTEGILTQGESQLFKITPSGPFKGQDTVAITNNRILHDRIKLGDYILLVRTESDHFELKDLGGGTTDTVQFIPTYFESTIDWLDADTLRLRDFISESLSIQRVPPATQGEGMIGMIVESDFDEEESSGRVEARRRVKKAGCSLSRRRTTGGGKTDQEEEFVLIAYKETDDNGEVNFGELPDGSYRLNIQYPGVPMDPTSFIEFEIDADGGIGGYELAATVTEDGITVEQVLGLRSNYFKDLNVFPVPANNEVNISYRRLLIENVKVKLVSLDGRILLDRTLETGNHKTMKLDVRGVEDGIYLLQVYNTEGTLAKYKIIVRN